MFVVRFASSIGYLFFFFVCSVCVCGVEGYLLFVGIVLDVGDSEVFWFLLVKRLV